jgi:RNA polymerase sigma factor (TIGR02999 family)
VRLVGHRAKLVFRSEEQWRLTPLPLIIVVSMGNVTSMLETIQARQPQGAEELLPLVYEQLRRIAAAKMAQERPGQTLQPTALVHEAWLRVSAQADARWQNREQFYAVAAETMRRILVDRARRRLTHKHGGHLERVELQEVELPIPGNDTVVLEVHDALEQLASEDPVKAEVVKLRFFVGLEETEIAALLGVSKKTVQRHWAFARAWLFRAMRPGK